MSRPRLRWYQEQAVSGILKSLEVHKRTLLVMATGGGKTTVASAVAAHFLAKGRVLFLAHRKELVQQGADRLHLVTGEMVDIEMAELWASNRARVVSASLDSMKSRLDRWPRDHFSLVIFDECQHSLAPSYRKVLEHFDCKAMGMTATPDRGDEKALGQVWNDVAGVFDIVDLINSGYLVPIRGRSVQISGIDLSHVGKSAGDLAAGELDNEIVKHVEGIVSKTLELEPGKQGIWFFPGVKSAELACDRINAIIPNSCVFVSGETPKDERDEAFRGFRSGKYQHISNCAICTEGTDLPIADMVVMGRPTLSRSLYAQCVGRGLRVLPGLVDHLPTEEGYQERLAIIASSAKKECVVVDYAGNAGKHTLVTPEDLLGGDYSEEEVKLAKKVAKEAPGSDVIANLEAARRELKAMMAKLQSKVKASVQTFDPFALLGTEHPDPHKERFREPMTPRQREQLTKFRVKEEQMKHLSDVEADKLIQRLGHRAKLGLCSLNQLNTLRKFCDAPTNLPFRQASQAMTYLAETARWSTAPEHREFLNRMVARK
jgi:superfamily II DNA or RNA helicase